MTFVTILWSMIAASCLTLAGIHLLVWLNRRDTWANLLFCLFAASTAALSGIELLMMKAQSAQEWGTLLRWYHVPGELMLLSMIGFVLLYLRAGRKWLAGMIAGIRLLLLAVDFVGRPNVNFREITGLKSIQFLGASVSAPVGVPSPWTVLGNVSLLLLILFVADASITAWRRGERRQALTVGGSILFFTAAATLQVVLSLWHVFPAPLAGSEYFLGIVIAIGYELSRKMLQAMQLARELQAREIELRESEYRLAMAAEVANLGIWTWEIGKHDIWASGQWRSLFAFTATERVTFDAVLQRLHAEDREALAQTVQKARREGGEYAADYRIVLPDGAIRWMNSQVRVEMDPAGKPVLLRGVSFDITRRKEAEERLRLVVEASPIAMVMVNHEGLMRLVNAQTEAVFGYERRELLGQSIDMLIPENLRAGHAELRRVYHAAPTARAMGAGRELFGRRKDGSQVPVEVSLNPVQMAEGMFVMASIVDITHRRRAEAESQRQRDELAHLSRVTTLGELSSSLAHELNQPLGAILRNAEAAEILLQDTAPDLEELRAIVADIRADDQRAGDVIDRLRSLLKNRPLESHVISIAKLVDEVIAFVRADAFVRGVRLEVAVPSGLPRVGADRVHLQQVLLNLIMNAMDAVRDRPHFERRVMIGAMPTEGKMVEVQVRDTGNGIPVESLSRIFEPFFTTKPNGMGIGLAVSRTIVEAHHGRIWASNNADRGATVRFTLPIAAEPTAS